MKTKISADFQICISAPLRILDNNVLKDLINDLRKNDFENFHIRIIEYITSVVQIPHEHKATGLDLF